MLRTLGFYYQASDNGKPAGGSAHCDTASLPMTARLAVLLSIRLKDCRKTSISDTLH